MNQKTDAGQAKKHNNQRRNQKTNQRLRIDNGRI